MNPVVIAGVISSVIFVARQYQRTEFDINRIWIIPAVVSAIIAAMLYSSPMTKVPWSAFGVGGAIGAAIGMAQAHLIIDRIDVMERRIVTKKNRGAFALMTVMGVAVFARVWLKAESSTLNSDLANGIMLLMGASICAHRLLLYLAYRRAAITEERIIIERSRTL